MWIVDLSFLQESALVFEENFIKKYYRIHTFSGKTFLVINEIKNYPHLVGIHFSKLQRLKGSEFLFECIKNNDTTLWTESMKRTFNSIFPNGKARGNNDIKITFFPMMPEIFIANNYVISLNYDKTKNNSSGSFDTEILISDFNNGMNIGMKQRNDNTFGFNSWRVEENENAIMELYRNQEIDLINTIEQFENGRKMRTKNQSLNFNNLWRLSRLVKNYNVTIMNSIYKSKIISLAQYEDDKYEEAMKNIKS